MMGRPPEPGLDASQARRFRVSFRRWRKLFGASNSEIANALERYQLCGNEIEGLTALQNALTPSRKLTHKWAIRLAVALFLSGPARSSERFLKTDRERAMALLSREKAAFWEAIELLIMFGTLKTAREPGLPAVIMPPVIPALAKGIAAAVVRREMGIGVKRRDRIAKAIESYLADSAPSMVRAWCDEVARSAGKDHAKAWSRTKYIEHMARSAFGDAYVCTGQAPSWGDEFSVLEAERPELTEMIPL